MNESVAGFMSGVLQTIVGHPFDTMKVWKQQSIRYNVRNLMNGVTVPLVSNSFVTSVQFTSYSWMKQRTESDVISGAFSGMFTGLLLSPIDKYKIQAQTNSVISCLSREIPAGAIYFGSYSWMRDKNIPVFASGSVAGTLSWLLTYPLDVYKTNIQSGEKPKPIFVVRGLGICLARAFIVNGVGFYVYESLKN